MEVLINNGTFFNELKRNAKNEQIAKNTRMPSIANTFKDEDKLDKILFSSSIYNKKWQQRFENPIIKSRLDNSYYSGRNLNILNTLKINAKRDTPDVIINNPYKYMGFT